MNLLTEKTRGKTNAWQSQEDGKRGEVNLLTEKMRGKMNAWQSQEDRKRGEEETGPLTCCMVLVICLTTIRITSCRSPTGG